MQQQELQQVPSISSRMIKFNEPALALLEETLLSMGAASAFVAMSSGSQSSSSGSGCEGGGGGSSSGQSSSASRPFRAFARLGHLVLSNIVNAAVFVQCAIHARPPAEAAPAACGHRRRTAAPSAPRI